MQHHRYSKYLRILTFLGDILALNGLVLTLYLTGHFIIDTSENSWFLFLAVLNLSWLAIVFYANPYKSNRVNSLLKLSSSIVYSVGQHLLITCTAIYLLDFVIVHKWGPLVVHFAFLIIVLFWRLSLYYSLSIYRARGYNYRNVVIIGFGSIAKQLEVFFAVHPEYGYRFVGYFDDHANGKKKLGDINELEEYIETNKLLVDEVYCCLPYVKYGQIKKIIDYCENQLIKVKVITDFRAFSFKGLELERYDHIPVLNVSSIPLDDRQNQIVKRGFDIMFSSLFLLFIASWLFPLIAILIKLDSKGPVFFRQKRTGKDNNDFLCLKFRTMYVNNEADSKQATKSDSRITKVGAFLRRTSLDELPQFINVLQGAMSVVGPRPHMLKHTEEYSRLITKFMARHNVKPGITGLAQSKGYRGETQNLIEMKNRVKLDRFYIENWSFLLDLKIIIATVISMAKGDQNAY
ncbi:undecaprenyl-phosphate glucose phosphotransferase [Chryseosolibacter indicus]|uniref:Undecaprenyl-phosphate glucose phosphotransferase n=1 Tax=Chryseosolibacter indicus TaxID=2782351 RepID=A0ABS5VT22_9BACT|nr:undecaprenyl-phosphate glucose phosphotransferase [Chryseosolibacter indicus]MBT1704568.1 undecaprenyl-phosphate glucose phosphotransferase [Chryseosolibacter indicus]